MTGGRGGGALRDTREISSEVFFIDCVCIVFSRKTLENRRKSLIENQRLLRSDTILVSAMRNDELRYAQCYADEAETRHEVDGA